MRSYQTDDIFFVPATRRNFHRRVGPVLLSLAMTLFGCVESNPDVGLSDSTLPQLTSNPSWEPSPPISIGAQSVIADEQHLIDTQKSSSVDTSHRDTDQAQTATTVENSIALSVDLIPTDVEGPENSKPAVEKTSASDKPAEQSEVWPQFRGPDGQGHASATGLPLRWNEKKNIVWKIPIRGHAWSSPVIASDRIWMTTAVTSDKSLRAICLDAATGETIHDIEVFRVPVFGGIHSKNSHATPTPVLVDDHCLVHFGSHGTALLDIQGNILWKTKIEYFHHHGPAGSPAISAGTAIIACDGMTFSFYDDRKIAELPDPQFVIALELATGAVRWKSAREGTHSYVTPLVIEVNGQTQVISPGGNKVIAYDPHSGEEIWNCRYQGYSVVPSPVHGHGLVFVCTGYDSPSLLAIRPNGRGDVTETHVAWKVSKAVPLMSSPVLVGDELYMVSNQGVVTCLDAKTGKLHWRNRIGGNHSSSPIFADGRLYFLDESGTTYILQPGLKFKVLAKNTLPGKTQASLAVSSRSIFLRSDTHLYRIEESNRNTADMADSAEGKANESAEKMDVDTNAKLSE